MKLASQFNFFSLFMLVFSSSIPSYAFEFFSSVQRSEMTVDHPRGVTVGDFTRRGGLDGFVALSNRNAIAQFSFSGNSFSLIDNPETSVAYGSSSTHPLDVAMFDYNRDGNLDLLVSKDNNAYLLWCRNTGIVNGKISLNPSQTFFSSSENNPSRIFLPDLNGDNNLDILITGTTGSGFYRLMQTSTVETLNSFSEISGTGTLSYTSGDFNHDGHIDVAVTNSVSNNVSVLFGASDGSGDLTRDANYPADASLTQAWGIQSADVNGDSHLDLIVTSRGANTLTVLAGDAMGHFSVLSSTPTCQQPTNLVLGDFNHDARTDAAVICMGDGGKLRILVGDGAGHFNVSPAQPDVILGRDPYDIVKGRFNSDSYDDLLVSVTGENKLVTLLGNTPPTFRDGSFDAATGTFSVTYVDADGDLPSSMKIRIGETGEFVDMQEVSATERDTTSGKRYQYRPSSLNAGTYAYFFQTSDGLHSLTFRNESSASLAQDIVPARSGGCSLNGKASSYSAFLFSGLVFMGWVRRKRIVL